MPAPDLSAVRAALLDARAVVCHTDADGLAAGALALRARGEAARDAVLLGRGQVPWGDDLPLPTDAPVAILDWGVRPSARRGVLIDHHAPETTDPGPGMLVATSYGEEPETPTAPLVRRILGEDGGPAWLAAVGAVGDLGDAGLRLPECAGAPKTAVRKLVPLVNAPRRLRDGPVRDALAILVEAPSPRDALADPRIELLEEARREWRAAFEAAVRTAPKVGPEVAVIRFTSPCQVHPLVATTWSRRLAPRIVLAANDDYLPGRVNFAVRGGPDGLDLRARLREALPEARGEFAHGHDRATGGSLTPEEFAVLVERLGVPGA